MGQKGFWDEQKEYQNQLNVRWNVGHKRINPLVLFKNSGSPTTF
jgi:hypothetical protein